MTGARSRPAGTFAEPTAPDPESGWRAEPAARGAPSDVGDACRWGSHGGLRAAFELWAPVRG